MMYNLYQGNTGKVKRIDESRRAQPRQGGDRRDRNNGGQNQPQRNQERPHGDGRTGAAMCQGNSQNAVRRQNGGGLMERLSGLLNIGGEEFETEDIILLMILYLMYRESGDSELLIIMGAMFLL